MTRRLPRRLKVQYGRQLNLRLSGVCHCTGNDPQPLTHDELWRLADHLKERRDRLLVLAAGYCGLRWGELAALRWADVDLANNTLRVGRAYSEEAPRGELSPVKDHQARTVPIPAVVAEELSRFRADQKPERHVFPSANSTPLRNRNFRRDVFDDTARRTIAKHPAPFDATDVKFRYPFD